MVGGDWGESKGLRLLGPTHAMLCCVFHAVLLVPCCCRWNLDSQLQQPLCFDEAAGGAVAANLPDGTDGDGGEAALKNYLQGQLKSGAHLLLITRAAESSNCPRSHC